jgi:hypothetical protein
MEQKRRVQSVGRRVKPVKKVKRVKRQPKIKDRGMEPTIISLGS